MGIKSRFLGLTGSLSALVVFSQIAACTSDSGDTAGTAGTAGISASTNGGATASTAGGATSGGSTAASGGTTSTTGGSTAASGVCASPILLDLTKPKIADFDAWDGIAPLSGTGSWSFALGGDSSTGAYAGPFGYGDRTVGTKTDAIETFDMVEGANATKYGLRIKDSMAQKYGGGMGIWLSGCLNATNFTGISFWVRGIAPTGKATLTVSMGDTTSSTPTATSTTVGTCPGTGTGDTATCVHPSFEFPVTDTWTQIKAPWSGFKPGKSVDTAVTPNGRNITQLQLGIGLTWTPDAAGVYVATLAPYELVSDTWAFY